MPEWSIVIAKNPLVLQTSYLPSSITLVIVFLAIILAFTTKNLAQKLTASFLILLFTTTVSLLFFLEDYSLRRLIIESKFDISYFAIELPFILYSIGFKSGIN